ncbi:hypothetical protein STEG23_000391, partial [Scotinomys teguina]
MKLVNVHFNPGFFIMTWVHSTIESLFSSTGFLDLHLVFGCGSLDLLPSVIGEKLCDDKVFTDLITGGLPKACQPCLRLGAKLTEPESQRQQLVASAEERKRKRCVKQIDRSYSIVKTPPIRRVSPHRENGLDSCDINTEFAVQNKNSFVLSQES